MLTNEFSFSTVRESKMECKYRDMIVMVVVVVMDMQVCVIGMDEGERERGRFVF